MSHKHRPGRTSSNRPPGQSPRIQNSATAPTTLEARAHGQKENPKKQPKSENAHNPTSPLNPVFGTRSAGTSRVPESTRKPPQAPGKGRYTRRPNKNGPERESALHNLKKLVNSVTHSDSFKSGGQVETFLHLAHKALSVDDRDSANMAAVFLGNKECVTLIQAIVEGIRNPITQPPPLRLELKQYVVPFIKVIVHKTSSSHSLDETFQTVLNTLCGLDLERAVGFFDGACQGLLRITAPL